MANQFNRNLNGFRNNRYNINSTENNKDNKVVGKGRDDDLIIEENTVYEIDRECYEQLKRQKKTIK